LEKTMSKTNDTGVPTHFRSGDGVEANSAVTEILGQASSAMSNSYNPSPLMMGAAAYLVLFFPVVVAARWIETRFAWKR